MSTCVFVCWFRLVLCQLVSLYFGFSLRCVNLSVWTLVSPCVVSTCAIGLWFLLVLFQFKCLDFGLTLCCVNMHGWTLVSLCVVSACVVGLWLHLCAWAGDALMPGRVVLWCRGRCRAGAGAGGALVQGHLAAWVVVRPMGSLAYGAFRPPGAGGTQTPGAG